MSGWDKGFTNVTEDLTVKAQFDINVYTVRFFDKEGAQIGADQQIEYGEAAEAPQAPDVEGYIFVRWNEFFDFVESDLDIYAIYEAEPPVQIQNLKVEKSEVSGDTKLDFTWDALAGAAGYAVQFSTEDNVLDPVPTKTNSLSLLLSVIVAENQIPQGTYTIHWSVVGLDAESSLIGDWAEGPSFEVTVPGSGTGVGNVQSDKVQSTKVLINGVLYIERNGVLYDVQGKIVK